MNKEFETYYERLLQPVKGDLKKLEKIAIDQAVPIIERSSLHFIAHLIQIKEPKKILEIGTGIGYSTIAMFKASERSSIITIERDEERYKQAKTMIHTLNKTKQIEVLHGDALEVLTQFQGQSFDFVFIDAAKGQYERFFERVHPLIKINGLLVCDNVLFRGYVYSEKQPPKRYKTLVQRLKQFNERMMKHPNYTTSILPIGDGLLISYKK